MEYPACTGNTDAAQDHSGHLPCQPKTEPEDPGYDDYHRTVKLEPVELKPQLPQNCVVKEELDPLSIPVSALPKLLVDLIEDPVAPSLSSPGLGNEVNTNIASQTSDEKIPGRSDLNLTDRNNDHKLAEKSDLMPSEKGDLELSEHRLLKLEKGDPEVSNHSKYVESDQSDAEFSDHKNDETGEEMSSFWTEEQMERLFHCKVVLEDTVDELRCKWCKIYRPTVKKLARHKRTHGKEIGKCRRKKPKSQYTCNLCKRKFAYKKYLIKHLAIKKGQHSCNKCNRNYGCVTFLNAHYIRCGRVKPFKCPKCKACFLYERYLKDHMVVHTKKQPYMCDVCGKTYAWKYDCVKHTRLHSQDNPYKCKLCDKDFVTSTLLKRHMSSVHENERRFICDHCEQRFNSKNNLKLHIIKYHLQVHGVEYFFQCSTCDKRYRKKYSLTWHMQLQHGERSPNQTVVCNVCHTVYTHRWSQNNCMKNHRKQKRNLHNFPCEICNKNFSSKSDLLRHLVCHSGDKPFKCDVCGKGFSRKGDMKVHSICHNQDYVTKFKCDICGKRCLSSSQLQTHLLTHSNDRPFECDQCGVSVKTKHILKRHKKNVHSGKSFQCPHCEKSYYRQYELRDHVTAVHSDNPVPVTEIVARKKYKSKQATNCGGRLIDSPNKTCL